MMRSYKTATFICLVVMANSVSAADFYISPNGNDSNKGSSDAPWRTISKANQTLAPGDTVYLRSGEYTQTISPARSGEPGKFITYKAYPGEKPVITDAGEAITLSSRSYIMIDGLSVTGKRPYDGSNLKGWATLSNATYNVIQNCDFQYSKGWSGIWIGSNSRYNKILNNTLDYNGAYDDGTGNDPGDSLQIKEGSTSNLIEGNTFTHGGHNLMEITGSYNIFRNNVFNNTWEDIEGPGKGNRNLTLKGSNGNGYNVFEYNVVTGTKSASDSEFPMAMKGDGDNQIIRNNFIFGNIQEAVSGAARSATPAVVKQKVFHNVFFNNGGPAWRLQFMPSGEVMKDNVFKNNIVYRNGINPKNGNFGADVYINIANDSNPDSSVSPISGSVVAGNAIVSTKVGDADVFVNGIGQNALSWFEKNYPQAFYGNIEAEPQFVSSSPRAPTDFRIRDTSSLVDKGVPLTETTNSGSGTVVDVADAGYFMDGFGIVEGDRVQIGANGPVLIKKVDYSANRITLATSITWNRGDGVSFPYNGSAPDIGAYETGVAIAPPNPPTFF